MVRGRKSQCRPPACTRPKFLGQTDCPGRCESPVRRLFAVMRMTGFDEGFGAIGADPGGLPPDAFRRPVGAEPMVRGHMLAMGGMLTVAGGAGVRTLRALAFEESLDGAGGDPNPELLLQKLIRH